MESRGPHQPGVDQVESRGPRQPGVDQVEAQGHSWGQVTCESDRLSDGSRLEGRGAARDWKARVGVVTSVWCDVTGINTS